MIAVSSLAKHFGGQTLFESVSVQFQPGQRYGIVGANGAGKSTLLRILSGEESASRGEVSVPRRTRLGVLRQDHFRYEADRILDVVMMGDAELWRAMVEKERILARAEEHFDGDRYAELEDLVVQRGGYALEARAGEILEGLGIPSDEHRQPLSTLSGGFKLRVLLAQVLTAEPDVLLLDEPTNHLDILSIRWLERFLCAFGGTALLVSHDHRFLDNISTQILDLDYETAVLYPGNYRAFTRRKREDRARREKEIQKQEARIAEQKAFVERFRAKATKARQAQSKLKAIDRIEIEPLPRSSRRHPRFRFGQRRPSGQQVLEIEGVCKSYDGRPVLRDVSLAVSRGERVAIIGPNGIGKSTLLGVALGEIEADAGRVSWGYEAHPGHVAQDQKRQIGGGAQSAEAWLAQFCPAESLGFVRGHLGAVLFSGDEAEKKLAALSGGEAARLIFARHSVQQPNVLVLDEPTNHLDLEAIEALVAGLRAYPGTLVFVSHDRWFVGELATRIVEITQSGINDFPGSYAEYLLRCGDDHLDVQAVLEKTRQARRGARPARERPRRAGVGRARRQLGERLEAVTGEIQAVEESLESLNERFCDPGYAARTPPQEAAALKARHRDESTRLEGLMREWETLERELQELPGP